MAPKALLLTSLLATSASAVTYLQRSQYCVAACSAALNHVSFDGKQPASASHGSPVPCSDKNYIQSLFYCASTYCTPDEARSLQFYLRRSGKIVAKYDHSRYDFWLKTIPWAAHEFESLKHLLVAVALEDEKLMLKIPKIYFIY